MDNNKEFIETVSEIAAITGELTVVGIGTDKIPADAFGPITAQLCKEANLKNIKVRGFFGDIFDAMTVNKKSKDLTGVVIAIDACLGSSVGEVMCRRKGVKPAAGLKKKLNIVGQHSILYVVGDNELVLHANQTRIGDIYNKSKEALEIIKEIDNRISLLTCLEIKEVISV